VHIFGTLTDQKEFHSEKDEQVKWSHR